MLPTSPIKQIQPAGIDPAEGVEEIAGQSNLTKSQFLMWLGQKLNGDAPLYNMVQTFTIEGALQPDLFRQAFHSVVERSDALRLVVQEREGIPQGRFLPAPPVELEIVDLSLQPGAEAEANAWVETRSRRMFDLTSCLYDAALIKLSANKFVWYLAQHHLITDGWSFRLVFEHTAEAYARLLEEESTAGLRALPSYEAYTAFERSHRSSQSFQKAQQYWREKMQEAPEPLSFYDSPARQKTSRTERLIFELSPERTAQLKALARRSGFQSFSLDLALSNLFATVFAAFLNRVGGVRQVTVGVPFHNRPTAAFKETIGLFIEICPIRIEVSQEETFASLYKKVSVEMLTAMRYAQPGVSSAETNRFYEVLLNFVNVSFPDFCGLPVWVDWIHAGHGDVNHSLRLQVQDFNASGGYSLHFDLNCNVFGPDQRSWAIRHFDRMIDALLEDPDQAVGAVSLLSSEEEFALVESFNSTQAKVPDSETVVSLFEAQVEATPGQTALVFRERRLTYRELNQLANRLAAKLQAAGVGPDKLAGICMEHSLETVVGLLGIMKAGGAYVPLDPAYPAARLAFMLEDIETATGEPPILLTQPFLVERLPQTRALILELDDSWETLEAFSSENPGERAGPENLAYVIYTSGSTGKPKGAMIEHRGLVNYLWWAKKSYLGEEVLDFPLFSSLSFDLTVTSIYLPLLTGGKLHIYREADGARGSAILQVIEDDQVDLIKLTPSHLAVLKNLDLRHKRVRKFIVGGEDFKRDLALAIHTAFDHQVEIYNEYGPTETVVGCMIHRFDPETDPELSVPIGRPADNAQIYVLDPHLNPVPSGMVGEMYVGGAGVARGYLNREELTRHKFLPDPFRPGRRMYRTGDLAKWQPNGKLAFLGRMDDQVKIGAVRIELGEVESQLREHPALQDCVIEVVQAEEQAQPQDVTYCTRCGLASNYPGVTFDPDGVCSICTAYEGYKDHAKQYFKTMDELRALFKDIRKRSKGEYDCLVLLSGGKDSTYMLYQVARMGMRILVFSLDNGYISEQTKDNIRRVVAELGVDHMFASTPAMKEIFADSLKTHSNVCNGCFKTIYTLAVQTAQEKGIPCIVTGLSRGQFFETRLTEDVFSTPNFDPAKLDHTILEARKAYHRREDIISRSLEVDMFRTDAVFEDIQFVDFYRYCNVELPEVYDFLDKNAPWVRPADTGRSTNCLINEVGIYVHKKQRGFHNYALPYSWDVRMGHKNRTDALEELQDEIDEQQVQRILKEIGYPDPASKPEKPGKQLAAYYVASQPVEPAELREFLAQTLPEYMLPAYWIPLESIPLTQNGKVDRRALPRPDQARAGVNTAYTAPSTPPEKVLEEIWSEVLGLQQIGIDDNFFEIGGSSLPALQTIARISRKYGVSFPVERFFKGPTIRELSLVVEEALIAEIEAMSDAETEQMLGVDGQSKRI